MIRLRFTAPGYLYAWQRAFFRGQLATVAASLGIFGANEGLDEELDIRHSIHKSTISGHHSASRRNSDTTVG